MRKFGTIFKEKQTISEKLLEQKILKQFKSVYSTLLESYQTTEFYNLDKVTQNAFIAELNEYWTEEDGLTSKGEKFLQTKTTLLTESATENQKIDFLRTKAINIIAESLRQANIKNRLYNVLDEMYQNTKATDINEVLPAKTISQTLIESFNTTMSGLMTEMVYELTDNNELNEKEFSKDKRDKLAKSGEAMKDGSYPIVTKQDLKNAIKAFGRTGVNKAETKRHIMKRAKALGAMDLIPDKWR